MKLAEAGVPMQLPMVVFSAAFGLPMRLPLLCVLSLPTAGRLAEVFTNNIGLLDISTENNGFSFTDKLLINPFSKIPGWTEVYFPAFANTWS